MPLPWMRQGEIVDLFDGLKDLENQVLRAVGVASERFNEDALRIMRGFRFQASLGFELEQETFEAMKSLTPLLDKISVERTFVEFDKLLLAPYWRVGLSSMIESQAYDYLPDMVGSQEKLQSLFDLEKDFTFEGKHYRLFIAVPPKTSKKLTALYTLDGNAQFPIAVNAVNPHKPLPLIVGIGYVSDKAYVIEERMRDYTFPVEGAEFAKGGKAADFLRFYSTRCKALY